MNRFVKTALAAALTASLAVILCSCDNAAQSSVDVSDTTVSSVEEPESVTPSEPESVPDSTKAETSAPEKEHVYVENGRFSLPDDAFSFALEDGWKMTDNGLAWQFDNEDFPYNNFNLVAATTYTDVEETTENQMLGTYQTMMTDFQLIDFQHIKVAGKPAVFMQVSGKYSMMTTDTVIYQYAIQSGDMLYTLSFSQGGWDDGFSDMIQNLIDSIQIA